MVISLNQMGGIKQHILHDYTKHCMITWSLPLRQTSHSSYTGLLLSKRRPTYIHPIVMAVLLKLLHMLRLFVPVYIIKAGILAVIDDLNGLLYLASTSLLLDRRPLWILVNSRRSVIIERCTYYKAEEDQPLPPQRSAPEVPASRYQYRIVVA